MLQQLRNTIARMERPPDLGEVGVQPFGIPELDATLGGGLARGTLHEISALSEAHIVTASGFALGVARGNRTIVWIGEDMARRESGAPFGCGLDEFGIAPERLLTVSVSQRRDLLWAMEETMRCPAVGAVIGELRHQSIDVVALRRLSLAACERGVMALLLRSTPSAHASTAATRWVVGAAPSQPRYGPGAPRFNAQLMRNRRGPLGSWMLEWNDTDECFVLASAHPQPVAAAAFDRSARQVA
jgi:protein ImuA